MRKLKKVNRLVQLTTDKPLPIIRFDISAFSEHLLRAPSNRAIQHCKPTIQNHITLLKLTAAQANTVCLASNQLMLESSLITIHQKIQSSQSKEGEMNWIDMRYNLSKDYKVYHCPQVLKGKQLIQHTQQSISYPFLLFKVKRYNQISVSFKDENHRYHQAELKDFQAWVFQQSCQQLNGESLLDWRINQGRIEFNSEAAEHFPKTVSVLEEYVQDLAKTFKEYPELLKKTEQFNNSHQRRNHFYEEVLPYENDFYRRLTKHYEKQMGYLEQRLISGVKFPGQNEKWAKPKDIKVKILDK